ncbi:GIY-YIG nuclease family protein [Mesorhizobium sp. M7A.F.Ca.MR.245.00.0.0]|uniref:GIY-YIG nuclease family protein n=1 Tax=Mesorhizobium sp. M7A.F.Ca.MR.245.00.0.0 TaxID=2496778 RepID=UPI000FCB7996|nr:GIY-YIG nuclease family protein [Mesorhizobium sp. M7A.F.Ca.MR.245.00.0.0]RUV23650.1 hypothetical protein EOB80_00630 [Mesorhizobium sp. M7A.F.Ca.MR.245.00.0.0]RUV53663.1 hypothetical protein EOB77_01360 [Mesorhizobium sp. M7A.F.Ca.MR.228.00.0.0]
MTIDSTARRRPAGRHKVKQADGVVTKCSSRVAKSGNQAHSFYIGNDQFSIFTDDQLSPVAVGDRVRFEYEIRHLRSGYRREYFSVIPESLIIYVPSELDVPIEGNVYILSNPSMPALLKVGYTTGTVAKRASELSGVTSVPTGFRIEWSLPILGDPKAVEQRAHAHLAPHRHGKEFFKVSLDEAKGACTRAFAELYPDHALTMDDAFAKRAEAEIQRRKDLEERAVEQQKERQKLAQERAFDASREGQWRKEGACEVVLFDYQYKPNFDRPSFFAKLFGAKFQDFIVFKIEVRQHAEAIHWTLMVSGRLQEKSVWKPQTFSTRQECMEQLAMAMEEYSVSNRRATIHIPNALIENPPILPDEYRNPRVTLSLSSLDGLAIRPAPAKQRHSRYS